MRWPARLVLESSVEAPRSFRSRFLLRGGNGNGPSVAGADDGACVGEAHECVAESLVADAELGAELRTTEGTPCAAQSVEHEGLEIARHVVVLGGRVARDDGEVDIGIVAGDELEAQRIRSSGGAVLDGEDERVLLPADVEVGVAPGVKVTAAAEREPGLCAGATVFACMMHDEDGDVVLALQGAEIPEQRGDLTGVVLVDAVQSDEGIEDEQARRIAADGVSQARLVAPAIEAQNGDGDDVDGNGCEIELSSAADAREARLDDGRRVLGHVEEDGARVVDVEGSEARGARGDRDGEIEREPGLAALGRAAEDADGSARPERVDEPACERVAVVEIRGADDG